MKSFIIGVGQCGGKLATKMIERSQQQNKDSVTGALALNTARADLDPLPIDKQLIGQDIVRGGGVGGDNEHAVEIMQRDLDEVLKSIADKVSVETQVIMVVAGLGGGTGSGSIPVLSGALADDYEIPVYAVGVLPSDDEGALRQRNSGRSLKTLQKNADATFLIDNNTWTEENQSLSNWYETINTDIANHFSLLFNAGEIRNAASESVVDTSEILNTLDVGGTAAIGYGETVIENDDEDEYAHNIQTATREALTTGLSISGDVTAETGLLLVAGDPEKISRKGVEKSRQILEEELNSYRVRGGDLPLPRSNKIQVIVLLGGLKESSRVNSLLENAADVIRKQKEKEQEDESENYFENDDIDDLL